LIHYTPWSSTSFSSIVTDFSRQVISEAEHEDDRQRWNLNRIAKYGFDDIFYTTIDGDVANVTFHKRYGRFLRVGINSYTLKRYRTKVVRPIWKTGGYLDESLRHSSFKPLGFFCTYYVKNRKIAAVVEGLKAGKPQYFSFGGLPAGWLSRFKILQDSPIDFRNVPQYISYANLHGDEEENYRTLIASLTAGPITAH